MTCAEKGIRRIRLGHQRWKTSSFVGKSSSFGTIQEYVHLEQVELRVDVDDGLPDPALGAAQAVSCNDHPPTYLRAAATICLNVGAKVAETADKLHLVACHQDMVG